jgi:recombinational DNA repair protein RecT
MSKELEVIRKNIELTRPDFDKLNLNGLNFFKEVEFACQILAKNSYLAGANPQSIQNAVKNVALIGSSLNPVLKYCYLIPRKEKINGQSVLCCVVDPSYIGMVKILTDTGSVVAISSTIVYEKEIHTLKIQEGAGGYATHKPHFADNPGKPLACYTIAVLPSGLKFVGLIRPFEWEDIMNRSEAVKAYKTKEAKGEKPHPTPWHSDKSEMIRKTAIKNIYKYLPKTKRAEMIANALDLDNQNNGINFDNQNEYHEESPAFTPDQEYVSMCNEETYTKLITLLDNELLGETFLSKTTKVANMKKKVVEMQEKNELTEEKAAEFVSFLEWEIAEIQKPEEERWKPEAPKS